MNLYEEYALLEAKLATLENKKDELRGKILEQMIERDEEKVETAVGSFKKATLKTWTYTTKVNGLKEDLEELKAHEQSTGDASYTEKASLRFSPVKL
jgi:hypothetical protein